jgi:hypothetical protein
MGLIKVNVADTVEKQFRKTAMQHFGYTKGSLSKAAHEAFVQWSQQVSLLRAQAEEIGDPIEAITGMLKHVKKSSVQLQHEISETWGEHARNRR